MSVTTNELFQLFRPTTHVSVLNDDQFMVRQTSGNTAVYITAEMLRAYILSRLTKVIQEAETAGTTGTQLNEQLKNALSSASEAIENAIRAAQSANTASGKAEEVAAHPTYIGTDNYIYEYSYADHAYVKTDKTIEASAFKISKTYDSVAQLNADKHQYSDGIFALVNTNNVEDPDNARLYVRKGDRWEFLVDMSGAIGFTGKTPQLLVGTIQAGANKSAASVSLTADGVDANGNPKYKVNFILPFLAYSDLTTAQIAELQKPASDMIATLTATNKSVTDAEAARVKAETARATAEAARAKAEETRAADEQKRAKEESSRATEEQKRASAESSRAAEEVKRANAESGRATAETKRAEEFAVISRKYPIIKGGTWWVWDADKKDYVDTNQSVNSAFDLTEAKMLAAFQSGMLSADLVGSTDYPDLF